MKNNIVSGEVTSVFPELNCFEIDGYIFFHGVKASTVKKLKLGEKISVEYTRKKIKSGDWSWTDFVFLNFKKIKSVKLQLPDFIFFFLYSILTFSPSFNFFTVEAFTSLKKT